MLASSTPPNPEFSARSYFPVGQTAFWLSIHTIMFLGLNAIAIFTGLASRVGAHFRSPDPLWDYWAGWIVATVGTAFLVLFPMDARTKGTLWLGWTLKVGITLGIALFYEEKYSFLDAYSYYSMGLQGNFAPFTDFGDGTGLINSLCSFFSALLPHYHAVKMIFSILGFAALILFFKSVRVFAPNAGPLSLLTFLALPSLAFWSSILGKEPIILLCIGIFTFGASSFLKRREKRYLGLTALGLLGIGAIRIWVAPLFLCALLISIIVSQRNSHRGLLIKLLVFSSLPFPFIFLARRFGLSATTFLTTINRMSRLWAHGGSAQVLPPFEDMWSFLWFLPKGVFTALFRPLFQDVDNAFSFFAALENLSLLTLMVYMLACLRWSRRIAPYFSWLAISILLWGVAYSFISYQNLGTAYRFRAQATPLILMFIIAAVNSWSFGTSHRQRKTP